MGDRVAVLRTAAPAVRTRARSTSARQRLRRRLHRLARDEPLHRRAGSNGTVTLGGTTIDLPAGTNVEGRDNVIVGLRPEALEIASDGLAARVEVVEELAPTRTSSASPRSATERQSSSPGSMHAPARRAANESPFAHGQARRTSSTARAASGWTDRQRAPRATSEAGEPDAGIAGSAYFAEIHEQPAALLRLLEHEADYAAAARAMAARAPVVVRLVGHGTSDNAASYGVYAFGLLPGWTALRDSISLSVYYGATLDFSRSIVIALSQSGRTPDVVDYVERARAGGALTIALTNQPDSALASAVEIPLLLHAGPELSVAATKTYFNELGALAKLPGA